MVYVFLADGFEEVEALTPVDILRRAKIDVKTVGVGKKNITGSHGITVTCDETTDTAIKNDVTAVVLPGGMPGTLNLENNKTVQKFIDFAVQNNILLAAICAAPSILGHKGILKGKKATCFNGFEKDLLGAEVLNTPTVTDGNIVTAFGAGAAFDFGYAIMDAITDDKSLSADLRASMRYK